MLAGTVVWLAVPNEMEREAVAQALTSDEQLGVIEDRFQVFIPNAGGVAAVDYAADNSHRLGGLVLWVSYPSRDISQLTIPVLSVYGSRDRMTTIEEVEKRRAWLPGQTDFVAVAADHWQFGHFARNAGGTRAREERADLQRQLIQLTGEFIHASR